MASAEFRQLLELGDVDGLRKYWACVRPGMPQPATRDQAEIVMHMTRTATERLPLKYRAYSHRWLTERDLPSQLPDELKQPAERLYPVTVDAVGISLNTRSEIIRPALVEVRGAMEYAVNEAYADGVKDPVIMRVRMNQARERATKALFGVT